MNWKSYLSMLLAVVVVIFLSLSSAQAETSDGWRMGMLTQGKTTGWFVKSVEGELNQGVDGVPLMPQTVSTDSKGNTTTTVNVINPWRFTWKVKDKVIGDYVGKYVVVKYHKDLMRNMLSEDTNRYVDEVYPIDKSPMPEMAGAASASRASKADGALIGRVVQVSRTGIAVKTWEATIQVGTSGGQYKFMTLENEDVYKACVEALKRAKLVQIKYAKLGIANAMSFANNDFRILEVIAADKVDNGL